MVLLTRRRVVAAALALLCGVSVAPAQRRDTAEDEIKAAFLYNFTKFIDWPDRAFTNPSAPFMVCAVADETFVRLLRETLAGERVRGREISIVAPSVSDDLKTCHVVYFGGDDDGAARRLPGLRQAPVLTVGQGRRFLEQGGLIAFVPERDRVRFSVSRRGADAAGLNVSSKLLRVARPFDGVPPP